MRTSNVVKKVEESFRRSRQKEIVEIRSIRNIKKKLGEVITKNDYHKTGHLRHGKF